MACSPCASWSRRKTGNCEFRGVRIRDWPDKPFRGVKLYLPGRNNIPFFKRFVRDFMALYKYNTLIMEMNAGMRLDSHPELNSGWLEFARDANYSRRNYPPGTPHGSDTQFVPSGHGGWRLSRKRRSGRPRALGEAESHRIGSRASLLHP